MSNSNNLSKDKKYSTSYIGLGSNLDSSFGNPFQNIQSALLHLKRNTSIKIINVSSCYISKPHGPQNQQDFHNAVAEVECLLQAEYLLSALQEIENLHQRKRNPSEHWGPRTLDLDILTFAKLQTNTKKLTLPHPELVNREFVLLPLMELAPDLLLPDGKKIKSLAEKCYQNGIIKLEQPLWP
jgi:2-amino-4-hydroxy-6-hydroxymethyldihydropteridine diphosphokinase